MWGECGDGYQSTSSSSDKRTTRVKKKKISRKELARRVKLDSLLEIYNDLSVIERIGVNESWTIAIKTVSESILNKIDLLSKIRKNLKKSDRIDLNYPITIHYKDK